MSNVQPIQVGVRQDDEVPLWSEMSLGSATGLVFDWLESHPMSGMVWIIGADELWAAAAEAFETWSKDYPNASARTVTIFPDDKIRDRMRWSNRTVP